MRTLNTFILLIITNLAVFGTPQYPDKLIYNGKEYRLHSNPMESYFTKYPDKRPERGERISTALWRGYVATFELKDNQLYLKDIKIQVESNNNKDHFETSWKSVLKEVFPNKTLIKVDWVTGLLELSSGKVVNHISYGLSTYEHYTLLEVENGNLKKEKHFEYEEYAIFKEEQFLAFKKTSEYERIKANLQKRIKDVESFLRFYIIDYTSKILTE